MSSPNRAAARRRISSCSRAGSRALSKLVSALSSATSAASGSPPFLAELACATAAFAACAATATSGDPAPIRATSWRSEVIDAIALSSLTLACARVVPAVETDCSSLRACSSAALAARDWRTAAARSSCYTFACPVLIAVRAPAMRDCAWSGLPETEASADSG